MCRIILARTSTETRSKPFFPALILTALRSQTQHNNTVLLAVVIIVSACVHTDEKCPLDADTVLISFSIYPPFSTIQENC